MQFRNHRVDFAYLFLCNVTLYKPVRIEQALHPFYIMRACNMR